MLFFFMFFSIQGIDIREGSPGLEFPLCHPLPTNPGFRVLSKVNEPFSVK